MPTAIQAMLAHDADSELFATIMENNDRLEHGQSSMNRRAFIGLDDSELTE